MSGRSKEHGLLISNIFTLPSCSISVREIYRAVVE
jgi:hypothetical protein